MKNILLVRYFQYYKLIVARYNQFLAQVCALSLIQTKSTFRFYQCVSGSQKKKNSTNLLYPLHDHIKKYAQENLRLHVLYYNRSSAKKIVIISSHVFTKPSINDHDLTHSILIQEKLGLNTSYYNPSFTKTYYTVVHTQKKNFIYNHNTTYYTILFRPHTQKLRCHVAYHNRPCSLLFLPKKTRKLRFHVVNHNRSYIFNIYNSIYHNNLRFTNIYHNRSH